MTIRPATRPRSSDLVHPIPLAAVALLIINDHLWKGSGALPAWLTGKISDFAGLFFFPVLLTVLVEEAYRHRRAIPSRDVLAWSSVVLTGAVFSALKSVPALTALATRLVGPVVCDPTDLFALVALALSLLYLRRATPATPAPPRWAQAMTVLFAATASLATSPIREVRGYPAWTVAGPATRGAGCARVQAWISKSGKQGLGVTLRFTSPEATVCPVQITGAQVVLAGTTIATLAALPPAAVASPPTAQVYLPFAFDNEAAWNEGKNAAVLRLTLAPPGGPELIWELPLEQRLEDHHVQIPPGAPGDPR